jgi:G:T-mismatch repair DNA endonuclease (very short patch repair protein)
MYRVTDKLCGLKCAVDSISRFWHNIIIKNVSADKKVFHYISEICTEQQFYLQCKIKKNTSNCPTAIKLHELKNEILIISRGFELINGVGNVLKYLLDRVLILILAQN